MYIPTHLPFYLSTSIYREHFKEQSSRLVTFKTLYQSDEGTSPGTKYLPTSHWEHPHGAIFETCDIWDTDYNSDNWEPEFITKIVIWQLIVTLDSIRNSCDVFGKNSIQSIIQNLIFQKYLIQKIIHFQISEEIQFKNIIQNWIFSCIQFNKIFIQ